MHDDHTSRRFPWFKLVLGSLSMLVLIGSFGGFMWLLRTYVDPPRVPSGPSAAELLASVAGTFGAEPSGSRTASRNDARNDTPASSPSQPEPGLPPPSEPYERAPPPPNAGAPLPSWAGSPLPNVPRVFSLAGSPPADGNGAGVDNASGGADLAAVTLDGPVPLPRPKPRATARVPAPVALQPPTAAPPRPKPPV